MATVASTSANVSSSAPPAKPQGHDAALRAVRNAIEAQAESSNKTRKEASEEGELVESPGGASDDDEDDTSAGEPKGFTDPDKLVTVFADPTNFNAKHPLYSPWTLWFDSASKQDKAKDWSEQLQRVMDLTSVEEFWGLWNNIYTPSQISVNSNFYLFRHGVQPAWEDKANSKGGKWSVQLPRDKSRDQIDTWWLYTVLAAIGETFETPYGDSPSSPTSFSDEVTGVIVSSRKMLYRISIWTRSSDSLQKVESIGKHLKAILAEGGKQPGRGGGAGVAGDRGKGSIATDVEFQSHESSGYRGKKGGKVWVV